MISVSCTCGRRFKAEDHHVGKKTRCPVCGNLLVIGQGVASTPSAVNDNGEVPSWWFPTSSNSRGGTTSSTTTSSHPGSDPDEMQTVILSRKSGSQVDVPGSSKTGQEAEVSGFSKSLIGLAAGIMLATLVGVILYSSLRPAAGDARGGAVELVKQPSDLPEKSKPTPPKPEVPSKTADELAKSSQPPPTSNSPATRATEPPATGQGGEQPGAAVSVAVARPATEFRPQLLVPAYFYPGGDGLKSWEQLIDAGARVGIVTVANPGNGPGEQRNADYFLVTRNASEKGVRVIGYIATNYGKRPLNEVKNEIDRWFDFYPHISGYFLDQQSPSALHIGYYTMLRDHARKRIKGALLISNPGAMCDEEYIIQSISDVICVFANFQGFSQFDLPPLLKQFSPTRFAALVYNIPTREAMAATVRDAARKRIGYLYVGDSPKVDNPYAKLPSYWNELVEVVAKQK